MRLATLTVFVATLVAGPALAATHSSRPISGWDGGTLGADRAAAYAGVGWPAAEAGFRMGIVDSLDLGVEGSWQYPRGWLAADVNARYLLWARDGAALSTVGRFGLFRNTGRDGLNDRNTPDTGVILGLGLHAGIQLGAQLVTAAIDVPFALGLKEESTHLPLLLSLGIDHPIEGSGRRPASIGFGVEAGPWGVGGPGQSFAYWAFVIRGTHGL